MSYLEPWDQQDFKYKFSELQWAGANESEITYMYGIVQCLWLSPGRQQNYFHIYYFLWCLSPTLSPLISWNGIWKNCLCTYVANWETTVKKVLQHSMSSVDLDPFFFFKQQSDQILDFLTKFNIILFRAFCLHTLKMVLSYCTFICQTLHHHSSKSWTTKPFYPYNNYFNYSKRGTGMK